MPFLIPKRAGVKPRDVLSRGAMACFTFSIIMAMTPNTYYMKTKLSLLMRLRIEVGTTKNANDKTRKGHIIGRIVKVLLYITDAIGRLRKIIGPDR